MSEVPWPYERCILCLNERELTLEHVIPRQIGGRLTARFLCKECNDELGHRIESRVRSDPSIQLASENLREQIPELATAIQAGETYLALGPGGKVPGSFKNGRFAVRSAEQDDGSLIHPTSEAAQHLRRILSRRGLPGDEVEQRLEEFAQAPDDTLVDLGVSVQAIRWGVESSRA